MLIWVIDLDGFEEYFVFEMNENGKFIRIYIKNDLSKLFEVERNK